MMFLKALWLLDGVEIGKYSSATTNRSDVKLNKTKNQKTISKVSKLVYRLLRPFINLHNFLSGLDRLKLGRVVCESRALKIKLNLLRLAW